MTHYPPISPTARRPMRRQAGGSYAYEAPRFQYKAVLDLDSTGFVRRYPTLWEAVTEE